MGGAPLQLLLLYPDGRGETAVLDPLHRPQLVVPGGVWQGAASTGAWSLVGTTMAPPYGDQDFELGDRTQLSRRWPVYADQIRSLTR